MKRVKIQYHTAYDTEVCGYVMAEEHDGYYTINKRQYKRCLDNRTVGGDAGVIFEADAPVYVEEEQKNTKRAVKILDTVMPRL